MPRGTSAWTLVDEDTVIQKVKQALRDSFQADDNDQQQVGGGSDEAQRTSRDINNNDDDNRPSRRRRIDPQQRGSSSAAFAIANANPMFQQLAADALREYQEAARGAEVVSQHHGTTTTTTTLSSPLLPDERIQLPEQPSFPSIPFAASQNPASGQQEYRSESAFFDLLHATAYPQEGQPESTQVQPQQQQQSQHQDPSFPTPGAGVMPEQQQQDDGDDSKPASK
jgi:hypothetical protein